MQNNTTQQLMERRGAIETFETHTEQQIWLYRPNGQFFAWRMDVVELEAQPRAAFNTEYKNQINSFSTLGGIKQAQKMMRGGCCVPSAIAYITKTDIVNVVTRGINQNRIMRSGIPGVNSDPYRWTGTKILRATGRDIERLAFGATDTPGVRFEVVEITDKNKTAGRLAKNYPNDTFLVVHGGRSGTHAFAIDCGTHCDWTYKPKTRLCNIWRVVK